MRHRLRASIAFPALHLEPILVVMLQARYVMSGPNLDQNNQTVRGILVSAMNNTLQLGSGMPVTLQSFASLASREISSLLHLDSALICNSRT